MWHQSQELRIELHSLYCWLFSRKTHFTFSWPLFELWIERTTGLRVALPFLVTLEKTGETAKGYEEGWGAARIKEESRCSVWSHNDEKRAKCEELLGWHWKHSLCVNSSLSLSHNPWSASLTPFDSWTFSSVLMVIPSSFSPRGTITTG
jgi:hypothetical protein